MKPSIKPEKPRISINLSLALLIIALLFFTHGFFFTGHDTTLWIGLGLVFIAFPAGLFSLVSTYRKGGSQRGKIKAWVAVIIGLILFVFCLLGWLIYAYSISFGDGGC